MAIALATLAVCVATESRLAIVWDEGFTLGREGRVRLWLKALADPPGFARSWRAPGLEMIRDEMPPPTALEIDTRGKLFSRRMLSWFWPFAREEPHGHPPFYAILGMIGDVVAPGWADLARARLGPMVAFSIAAGAIFVAMAGRYGVLAALTASGAWLLQPRLFAHAHYALYDAPLTSLWVAAIVTFAQAVQIGQAGDETSNRPRWGWAVGFGVLAGWAAGTKFTGWFLPFPFLAWAAVRRDRRGLLTLLVGGCVGLLVLYVFTPPWWRDPIGGVAGFLRSNLSRGETLPIGIEFLGVHYLTPNESLPWYNTLVWTLFVTPVGFLVLAILGASRGVIRARSDPFALLVLLNWSSLIVLRSLPHTPGHDGERQILPAFGMLALLAGIGAAGLRGMSIRAARVAVGLALAEGIASVALMMPVLLSYYSPIVGGLPGAVRLGMEPTYYWDALHAEPLDWLRRYTPRGRKTAFSTYPSSWLYLQSVGAFEVGIPEFEPGDYAWYIVQNRTGVLTPRDRALILVGKWDHVVTKWGVPLLYVFPFREVERYEAVKRIRRPEGAF